jgi:hypothetical protein
MECLWTVDLGRKSVHRHPKAVENGLLLAVLFGNGN